MNNNKEFEFEEVYTKNSHLIYHIAYSYLKNEEDAKDIHQDVFIKYLTKNPKIKKFEEVKYWLIRVTINECINFINYKKKHSIDLNDEVIYKLKAEHSSEENIIYSFVCDLEPIYKNIIILFYYDDMSTKEIAKLLKKKESTIRMRLHRARNILKERMEEYENGSK